MTTDTTAPAADDLREAIAEITDHYGAADAILALIAPSIAAAHAEGRREGIAEAAEVADGLGQQWADDYVGTRHSYDTGKCDAADLIKDAIRALADAPRQDAGGMTEGG